MSQAIGRLARVYVDQATGSDSNPGTQSLPLASMSDAVINRLKHYGGTIFLRAPEADPYEGSFGVSTARDITIRPWGGTRWYMVGTPGSGFALRTVGTGLTTLYGGHVTGLTNCGIRCGDTGLLTGRLLAYDTYAEGPESGWQTVGTWQTFDAHRCTGLGAASNDGFNLHGDSGCFGVASLYDCTGDDCGDEGVSPHEDVILNIYGGQFCGNADAGMAAVGNAVCNIYDSLTTGEPALFDGNGANLGTGHGGVTYLENTSGSIDGATMTGNTGPGLTVDTTGTVTLTDYASSGNTEADVLP